MNWGKYFWTTIHVAALGFPDVATDTVRQKYKVFYTAIGDVLPCSKCRANYHEHFLELPIDFFLVDKHTLFAWTVKLHNIVNVQTKKKEWSVEESKEYYTKGTYALNTRSDSDAVSVSDKVGSKQTVNILIILNVIMLLVLLALFGYKMLPKLKR